MQATFGQHVSDLIEELKSIDCERFDEDGDDVKLELATSLLESAVLLMEEVAGRQNHGRAIRDIIDPIDKILNDAGGNRFSLNDWIDQMDECDED
jgi:hypothetical protein